MPRVESQLYLAFFAFSSVSAQILCDISVYGQCEATMQLDPLAEALAYRKMCNYIVFYGMMPSLPNNYKHLNQAEIF